MFEYLSLLFFVAVVNSHSQSGLIGHGLDDPMLDSVATEHLYQGDVMLTPMQEANLKKYGNPYGPTHRVARAASARDSTRWPNAVIPYMFNCSVANIEGAILSVKKAMEEWESKTCIRFKKRTTETSYVQFFRGTSCWGNVGYTPNFINKISIGKDCDFQHVMAHEIGHAVGFWHEHNRPDRDKYIKVLWNNILPGQERAFTKRTWGNDVKDFGSPYDFGSIMHYPLNAQSIYGLSTLQALVSTNGKRPYRQISPDDIMQTNAMYKCDAVTRKRMNDDFVSHFKPTPRIVKRSNTCKDMSPHCKSYLESGLCDDHDDSLLYWCPVTCDMCSSDDCMDTQGYCRSWLHRCHKDRRLMKLDCPHTCGFCGIKPTDSLVTPDPKQPPSNLGVGLRCKDKKRNCASLAASGECEKSGPTLRDCLVSCKAKCDKSQPKPKGRCADPMGLGWNNRLSNRAFSASSVMDPGGGWKAAAHGGRLYFEEDTRQHLIGAWCPKHRHNQWLKIDLGRRKRLTGIATQGRDSHYEHVKKYELEFSRDGRIWTKYPKVFDGNCDHYTPVFNTFSSQVARFVRILPNGTDWSWPCLRVELYGCAV